MMTARDQDRLARREELTSSGQTLIQGMVEPRWSISLFLCVDIRLVVPREMGVQIKVKKGREGNGPSRNMIVLARREGWGSGPSSN